MSGILLIGWAPWEKKPGGEIIRNILPYISKKFPQQHICLLFEGPVSNHPTNTNIEYFGFSWDVENETIKSCYGSRGLLAACFLVTKKLFTKINRHFFHVRFQHKQIKRIVERKNIGYLLCLTEWTNVRVDALPLLQKHIRGSVYLTELPLKHRYTEKEALNKKAIARAIRKGYEFYAPQDDVDLVSKYIKRLSVRPLEYPLFERIDSFRYRKESDSSHGIERKLLVYFGSFYPSIRNPTKLFSLLEKMPDYELHVYGADCGPYESVPANCIFHGRVAKETLDQEARRASALVNVENTNTLLHSSKIISLLSYHLPVLSFGTRQSLKKELDCYGLFFDALESDGQLKDPRIIKEWLVAVSSARSDAQFDTIMEKFSPQFFVNEIFRKYM